MSRVLQIADLFAGAGGTTTGVLLAVEILGLTTEAVAVNHWPTAVATHSENHRHVRHYCADIQTVDPREVVPSGRLDLLWASPECTHHSRARGGKPVSEQKRSGADWVLDWLEQLDVRCLILENVEEWLSWGDVKDGKPVSKTRGRFFVQWWNRLERLGYRAEYRVLNAAEELAAAMGFPSGYRFTGTKTDIVRQIGNAVACGTAKALTLAMFGEPGQALEAAS